MSVPKDYEENTPLEEQSLINFLTDLSLVADIDEADTENGVTLMTMHWLGLEFPIVFIMGMEESLFPHIRAIKSEDDHEMQRERRICYVAITRAEVGVIYHSCDIKNVIWSPSVKYAIQIFKEIPESLLENHSSGK
ncbi:3'-5' exonuclease [Staphylococcus aureus]